MGRLESGQVRQAENGKWFPPLYRLPLISLTAILFATASLVTALSAEEDYRGGCTIPATYSSSRPDPSGTPTDVAVGLLVIDINKIDDAEQMFLRTFGSNYAGGITAFLMILLQARVQAVSTSLLMSGTQVSGYSTDRTLRSNSRMWSR